MVTAINKFMNQPLMPGRILLGFTGIILFRTFLEVFSRKHSLFLWDDFYRVLMYYLHPYISWLSLFASIAFLIAFFMGLRYRESVLFTLLFSPLILIVPIIDTILGKGHAGAVKYGENFDAFLYEFTHLFDPFASIAMVTTGVRLEVFLVVTGCLFFGLFVFKKGFLRSCTLALSIYTAIFMFGYLPAIYTLCCWGPDTIESLSATGILFEQVLFFLYLIPVAVIAILTGTLLIWEKGGLKPSDLLIPATGFISLALVVGGFFHTAGWLELTDRIINPGDLFKLVTAVLSLYLLLLTEKLRAGNRAIGARPVLLTLSAILGGTAAAGFILFWLLIASVIFLYGHPPFELRRIPVIRHFGEPLISVTTLLAGTSLILPYGPWRPFDGKGTMLLLLFLAVAAVSIGVHHGKLRSDPSRNIL
ncbi:MAG: hypothetical protein KKC20_05960 [Proteobacteria bacterium]|nr:hypothetical protein [Pseudomonadota bacterium]